MSHVHSWRRFSDDRFICQESTCFVKADLRLYDKKLVKCPFCQEHFLFSWRLLTSDTNVVCCENCGQKRYSPATIEEIHLELMKVARETYKPIYDGKLREVELRLKTLSERETSVFENRGKLAAEDSRLENLKLQLVAREQRVSKRETIVRTRWEKCRRLLQEVRMKLKKPKQVQEGLKESIEEILRKEMEK